MTRSLGPLDPVLITIVLTTLAIGLPILMVLSIRLLWDRNLTLGRSKQLEKLIGQLDRIASVLEHKMNLSFPADQSGTEEPDDIPSLQQLVAQPPAAQQPTAGTTAVATPSAAEPAAHQLGVQQPVTPQPADQQPVPLPGSQQSSAESPRRAGVKSMFGI